MCGLAGIVRADAGAPVEEAALLRMARALRHRGPDGFGLALDPGAGLVSTRLAIIDIAGGWQPMAGAAGALLVFTGELFNHVELRAELRGALRDGVGHRGAAAAARARRPRRAGPRQRRLRLRVLGGRPAPAYARPRPLRRAPAPLRGAPRRRAGLRLGGQGAVRLRRGGAGARPRRAR